MFLKTATGLVSNINDECVVNASETTPRRCSISGVFWGVYGESTEGRRIHAEILISIKIHSSNFVGITLLCQCSPVSLLRVFRAPYHGMISEGRLSIHYRLQLYCIVNVNICIKGPDDKTMVFCRPLQILT